jgi:hypothetical protein
MRGDTFTEVANDVRDSLTRRAVSSSDTLIILEDQRLPYSEWLTVAHLSACGWLDLFKSSVELHNTVTSDMRHVALTPSQLTMLRTRLDAIDAERFMMGRVA